MNSENRKKEIEEIYGFDVTVFTPYHMRVTDGEKTIDLFVERYHMIETGERGDIIDYLELIHKYFLG